jgi:hypothetical protein
VCTFEHLAAALGTESRMTVFRKLADYRRATLSSGERPAARRHLVQLTMSCGFIYARTLSCTPVTAPRL